MKKKNNFGFTLAEILVTLAIIGIVATLTVSSILTKYNHRILESQFKKSVRDIQQIVLLAKNDLGIDHFGAFCSEHNGSYYNASTCFEYIVKHANLASKRSVKQGALYYDIDRKKENLLTYNGNPLTSFYEFSSIFYTNKMQDGSFLGFLVNGYRLHFGVDLNGYKKPNKLGHDIFLFHINNENDVVKSFSYETPNNDLTDEEAQAIGEKVKEQYKDYNINIAGYPCNIKTERSGNGVGCSYFALKNVCPYDTSRKYFDCLP